MESMPGAPSCSAGKQTDTGSIPSATFRTLRSCCLNLNPVHSDEVHCLLPSASLPTSPACQSADIFCVPVCRHLLRASLPTVPLRRASFKIQETTVINDNSYTLLSSFVRFVTNFGSCLFVCFVLSCLVFEAGFNILSTAPLRCMHRPAPSC